MAILFLDTSALVKLYVQEDGTERMLGLAHPDAGHRLTIMSISRVEFRAAIRHRTRLGHIESPEAEYLLNRFRDHLTGLFLVQPVNEAVLEAAGAAIDRHGLRAYDGVQLGGCLTLIETLLEGVDTQFVSADERLLEAARRDGLGVVNPNANRD